MKIKQKFRASLPGFAPGTFLIICAIAAAGTSGGTQAKPVNTEVSTTVLAIGGYWRAFAMSRQEVIPLETYKEKKKRRGQAARPLLFT